MIEFQLLRQLQQLADGDNTDRRQSAILRWQILRDVKRPIHNIWMTWSISKNNKNCPLYLDYMEYFPKQLSTIIALHEVFLKKYSLYSDYMKYSQNKYPINLDYMKYFPK